MDWLSLNEQERRWRAEAERRYPSLKMHLEYNSNLSECRFYFTRKPESRLGFIPKSFPVEKGWVPMAILFATASSSLPDYLFKEFPSEADFRNSWTGVNNGERLLLAMGLSSLLVTLVMSVLDLLNLFNNPGWTDYIFLGTAFLLFSVCKLRFDARTSRGWNRLRQAEDENLAIKK